MVNWKESIYPFKKFTEELTQEWINSGFNKKETREWLESGLQSSDAKFAKWLRRVKKVDAEWFSDYVKEEELRKAYNDYSNGGGENKSKAQQWLESQEEYNTETKRKQAKELDISGFDYNKREEKLAWDKLEGELDLSEFINLEGSSCTYNQLTSINLRNCKNLKEISCAYNKLTKLDLTGLNELEIVECCGNCLKVFDYRSLNFEELTWLNIGANNLPEQDLTVFSKFINLKALWIGNRDEDIQQGFSVNRFYGSLEPLKNLTKLRILNIDNTDIDSGLEHLPNSVEEIYCSSKERKESKVSAIENLLKNSDEFVSSNNSYERKFIGKNIEEYLEKKYSNKENTKKIVFNSNTLQLSEKGELVISDYPELEIITSLEENNTKNISKTTITNCPKLKEINIINFVDNEKLEISNCPI